MIILTSGMVMVTLVIIIILMIMNIMDPMDSTQALTDAQNGVVQTSEPMEITQEKSESEQEDDDNASDDDIRASYYQYEGELSTEPLKPEDITYIENEDILDYFRDEATIAKYKEAILNYAKDFASKRPVYGNPTIIKGCEPAYDTDGVIVDLHTDMNEDYKYVEECVDSGFWQILLNDNGETFTYRGSSLDSRHWPIVQDDMFIFNSDSVYAHLIIEVGISPEQASEEEKQILNIIKEALEDEQVSKEYIDNIPYVYLDSLSVTVNEYDESEILTSFFRFAISEGNTRTVFNLARTDDGKYHLLQTPLLLELRK